MRASREATRSFRPVRSCRRPKGAASSLRPRDQIARRGRAPARSARRPRSERAAADACARRRRAARLAPNSSSALASQTVQVTTEAKASPIITALTTMSAAMNMPQGDRSWGTGPGGSDYRTKKKKKKPMMACVPVAFAGARFSFLCGAGFRGRET